MTVRSANRSAAKRQNFTKKAILALKPSEKRRIQVYDTKVPALVITVTPTGAKSFYLYRRVRGHPQRIRLGGFPELTVEQARRKASVINAEIAQGGDPAADRRSIREEMSLAELFNHYLEAHAKPHKRTWADDKRQFDKYLKQLHSKRLSAVTHRDVAAVHAKIGKQSGPYQANRVLALLTAVFNFAARSGWDSVNPCKGVRRFKEQSRDRFLNSDELRRFFQALADEPDRTIRDFILIALMTGARRANVQAMRWDDVDLDRGIWRISESESKSGEPMVVILPIPAVDLLRSRHKGRDGEHVFRSYGKRGHIVDIRSAWRNLLERAKIENLRLHDLRRTLGSWQAACGASLPIIGRALGHKDQSTTAVYARLDLDPVRQSVETAVAAMLTAGESELLDAREVDEGDAA